MKLSRNKHLPYIASYHGPWLELPHEILDSLFSLNLREKPYPISPEIFQNLTVIRKLVDDAKDLAIKSAPGILSESNSVSKQRQRRLCVLAVVKVRPSFLIQKPIQLARAYAIDEIATSVLQMQNTALDDIADRVLAFEPCNKHALYVSFFHEKIQSSRMLSTNTSTDILDELIKTSPESQFFRTRAMVYCFREEFIPALRDFKVAIQMVKKRKRNIQKNIENVNKVREDLDHNNVGGSEAQLFFLRASACHHYAVTLIEKCVKSVNEEYSAAAAAAAKKRRKKRNRKKGKAAVTTAEAGVDASCGNVGAEGDGGIDDPIDNISAAAVNIVIDDPIENTNAAAVNIVIDDPIENTNAAVVNIVDLNENTNAAAEKGCILENAENCQAATPGTASTSILEPTEELDVENLSPAADILESIESFSASSSSTAKESIHTALLKISESMKKVQETVNTLKAGGRNILDKQSEIALELFLQSAKDLEEGTITLQTPATLSEIDEAEKQCQKFVSIIENPPLDDKGRLDVGLFCCQAFQTLEKFLLQNESSKLRERAKKKEQPPPKAVLEKPKTSIRRPPEQLPPDTSIAPPELYMSKLQSYSAQIRQLALRSIRDMDHFLTYFTGPHSAVFKHTVLEKRDSEERVGEADASIGNLTSLSSVSDEEKLSLVKDFVRLVPSTILAYQAFESTDENSEAVRRWKQTRQKAIVEELDALDPAAISAMYQTYHPLMVECYYIIGLNYLLIGDWDLLTQWHKFISRLVESCEGYPVFLPARSMGQSDYIESLVGLECLIRSTKEDPEEERAMEKRLDVPPTSIRRSPIRTKRVDIMMMWMQAITLPEQYSL
ncbi:MAG: hypothetical protein SGCHY_005469 [Lobulomycetales sp.]